MVLVTQGFYLFVKFGLVLIYILKIYRIKSSSILLRKNMFHLLLAFCFWKACTFCFESFLNWNSRNYSQIYLSGIINYWGNFSIIHNVRSVHFGLCSIRISFFLSFFLLFFFFYRYVPWQTLTILKKGNNYFCFPIPPANEHSFNSSRFLQLIFTQCICNYQTESWWDLFSLDICFLFAFLWMQLSRSYWHSEDLNSYQIITLLLPSERLNKLRFTPLPTVYLSHLLSPIPSYNLPSNQFPKYIRRNKRCFIFLQEIGRKITENNFRLLK